MKSAEESIKSGAPALSRSSETTERMPFRRVTMRVFDGYARFVLSTYCPTRVIGREHVPKPPFLLCSNHCSHMDSTVLMVAAGRSFEDFGLIGARDYFVAGGKWKSALQLIVNVLPVDRRANRKTIAEHIERCRQFVAGGQRALILYPEGTRSKTGEMQPFKRGAAMLALELGIPIVPAYIDGTYKRWPKGTRLIRPGRIQVALGPALYPHEFTESGADSGQTTRYYAKLTEELEARVRALGSELCDDA